MSHDLAIKTPASLNVLYFYNVNSFPMLTIDTDFVINAYECLNGCVNPKMLLIDISCKDPCAAYAICNTTVEVCKLISGLFQSMYLIKQNQEYSLKGCGLKHWNVTLVTSYACNEVVLGKKNPLPIATPLNFNLDDVIHLYKSVFLSD